MEISKEQSGVFHLLLHSNLFERLIFQGPCDQHVGAELGAAERLHETGGDHRYWKLGAERQWMIFLSRENLNRNTACAKTHHWFLLFKRDPLKKIQFYDTFLHHIWYILCFWPVFFLFFFIVVDFIFLRLTTISILDTTPVCLCVCSIVVGIRNSHGKYGTNGLMG